MGNQPLHKLFGDYRCIHTLEASNDMSLFQALNRKTGKSVMLRVLKIHLAKQERDKYDSIRQECLNEMARVQKLTSPYLVPVLDYGVDEFYLYAAMPLMRGGSLHKRLKTLRQQDKLTEKLPSLGQISDFIQRIADALQDLHRNGMVHGQVEPRAVLFDETGKAYLNDAGIVRLQKIFFNLESTNSFSVTRYSAPELWDGQRPEPASDQYALACLTYELITGRAPFESDSLIGLMNSHRYEAAMPPGLLRPELSLPPELPMVLWQALAKPPSSRFSSVTAFAEAFARVVSAYRGTPTDFFTFSLTSQAD